MPPIWPAPWQSIVFGFAGLRLVNGVPEFKFYIPEAWNGYHFTVKIKRSVLAVDVLPDGWTITLQSGDAPSTFLSRASLTN